MRYMILVKATADFEAGASTAECLVGEIADYLGELADAGVLVDVNRLEPSATGWRIECSGGRKIVTDGPFAESKELIAGYTIIDVASREEAMICTVGKRGVLPATRIWLENGRLAAFEIGAHQAQTALARDGGNLIDVLGQSL